MYSFEVVKKALDDRGTDYDFSDLYDSYQEYFHENVAPGDGVTVHYWSDAHACTVIRRTRNKLVLQQDTAILSPDFKPEFIPGGFCAHCTNQGEQSYTYERNPEGRIYEAYWSERKKGWYADKSLRVSYGRHEYYDYNF